MRYLPFLFRDGKMKRGISKEGLFLSEETT
jgi:hypothetical protein